MIEKNKIKIISILFFLISAISVAQPPPPPPPPVGLPIDGGILIAAFVAICYGAKKIIKK